MNTEDSQLPSFFPPLFPQPAVHRCGVGPPGVQVSLEQQAYMLLTEPERQTMAYYLQEYQEGHIAVQALVMALFELFNTHAKVDHLISESVITSWAITVKEIRSDESDWIKSIRSIRLLSV